MKHYGDITKIRGDAVPPVDVITGGSPCQDLSVAGLRKGLAGERSGLFLEQIRIIKEMRSKYVRVGGSGQLVRLPRYCIWENVPGAYSSNGGKDFQAVLTEFARIEDPSAPDVPMPEKGRWPKSGCIYDELGRWSIAWRLHDAQFWGVPQRRKRIALVADFGGLSAPEILFEREGVRWDSAEGGAARKEAAAGAEGGAGETSYTLKIRGGREIDSLGKRAGKGPRVQEEKSGTIGVSQDQTLIKLGPVVTSAISVDEKMGQTYIGQDIGNTLGARDYKQPQAVVASYGADQSVYDARGNGNGAISPTITGDHNAHISDYTALCVGNGQLNQMSMSEQCNTLDTMHDQQAVLTCGFDAYNQDATGDVVKSLNSAATDTDHIPVVFGMDRASFNQGENAKYDFSIEEELIGAQTARGPGAVYNSVVRRLTPLECERLQGFPDGWTDIGDWVDSKGKLHKASDSPRYKALGNSIAVGYANGRSGFWCWMARRICAQYERQITMASLFDGIGGFPLAFQAAGAIPVWASEIEEFPIAVTKLRFPEKGDE